MEVTLDSIKSTQEKLAGMIAQFEANVPRQFALPATAIQLFKGEHYAGIALDAAGAPLHHLVLLSGQATGVSWDRAVEWAAEVGGELPTRSEQALLYANLKGKFEANWYWSAEQHAADPSYAWVQTFSDGSQGYNRKSYEGRARAVRRLAI
jgi:hypothetical protein